MHERKEYNLSQFDKESILINFRFYQEELSVKKSYDVLDFLASLKIDDLKKVNIEKLDISSFISLIRENRAAERFLSAVLIPGSDNCKDYDFSEMKFSAVEEIIGDFFILNPSLQKRLLSSKLGLAISNLMRMSETSVNTVKT